MNNTKLPIAKRNSVKPIICIVEQFMRFYHKGLGKSAVVRYAVAIQILTEMLDLKMWPSDFSSEFVFALCDTKMVGQMPRNLAMNSRMIVNISRPDRIPAGPKGQRG